MDGYEEIEKMLSAEEDVGETIKNYLVDHIKDLSSTTGMNPKELLEYIDRLVVM